jgi:hypothetical protein
MTQTTPPPALAHGETSARGREARPLRERAEELTKRLRSEHDEFERAAQSWTPEAEEKKREARKARETTLKEIHELLASGGEAERATRLERLPVGRRLIELEAWLGLPTVARPSLPAPGPRTSAAPPAPSPSVSHSPPAAASPEAPPQPFVPAAPVAVAPVTPEAPAPPTVDPVSDRKVPAPTSSAPALQAAAALDGMPEERSRHESVHRMPDASARHRAVESALEGIGRHRKTALGVGAGLVALAIVAGVWIAASHRTPAGDATPPQSTAASSAVAVPQEPTAGQADITPTEAPEAPPAQPETSAVGAPLKHPVAPVTHARPRSKPGQVPPAHGPHPHEAPTNPY